MAFGRRNDTLHTPVCQCCQTLEFLDFLGVYMKQLSSQNKLPVFEGNGLSRARIRRAVNIINNGSNIRFEIERHPYAIKRGYVDHIEIQTYQFSLEDVDLALIDSYIL